MARAALLLATLWRVYGTLGSPTLRPVLNPWLDEDWLLETPLAPVGAGHGGRRALPETIGFPKYSKRWPPSH